jgi:EAL and modified HD-GYP domain-containing signal transduction protein
LAALDVVVGRQPIFDRHLTIVGYEVLSRRIATRPDAGPAGSHHPADGDLLTTGELLGGDGIRVDRLVGDRLLFCRAERGVLTGAAPVDVPPERAVLQVPRTLRVDDEVMDGCRRLRDRGFALALDGSSSPTGAESLLELASFVKIDVHAVRPNHVAPLVERWRPIDVTVVAERVESADDLARCEALPFDLFQGNLLSRGRVTPGPVLAPARQSKVRMAARLLDSECPMAELEEILRSDPALVHQLLTFAGTGPEGGMRRAVRTVREALVLVGWRRLQSWVSLLMIADKGPTWQEEITGALTRARMCELAAASLPPPAAEEAFMAAMVSCFGILLGERLDVVVESLPLDDEVRRAILGAVSPLGRLVADAADYQSGHPDRATRSRLGEAVWAAAAYGGLTWAVEMASSLGPEAPGPSQAVRV